MRKILTTVVMAIVMIGLSTPAAATICAMDAVPASTLLFPFVVYEYGESNDLRTTLVAITNVSSDAQIVHLTVWTDYSIAILDFNLVLTGYDVQTINIRDILRDGILPSEDTGANIWETNNWDGSPAPKPFDDGPFSTYNNLYGGALDSWFSSVGLPPPEATSDGSTGPGATPLDCDPGEWISSVNNLTLNIPPEVLGYFRSYLEMSQTANRWYANCFLPPGPILDPEVANPLDPVDFDNHPWFVTRDRGPVWMYITADVVGTCNKDLPDSDGINYFGGFGAGIRVANVLIGDVIYLDPEANFSEALNAVHIEAQPGIVTTPADSGKMTTFYHRFHGFDPVLQDWREPLPTAWALRYIVAPQYRTGTWIQAWKGTINNPLAMDLSNGSYGLDPDDLFANSCTPYTYYAWDEDENVNSVGPGSPPPWSGGGVVEPIPVPNLLPLETQEVNADQFFLVDPDGDGAKFGWLMFIWPRSNTVNGLGVSGALSDQYQTWMAARYGAYGRYTAGVEGKVLANYNCDATQVLPQLGIGMFSEPP